MKEANVDIVQITSHFHKGVGRCFSNHCNIGGENRYCNDSVIVSIDIIYLLA